MYFFECILHIIYAQTNIRLYVTLMHIKPLFEQTSLEEIFFVRIVSIDIVKCFVNNI